METSERTRPNQGIWRSGYNGLRVGLLCLVNTALVVGIVESFGKRGFVVNLQSGLLSGLAFGIAAGVNVSLFYGGAAFIKHGLVRLVLWGSHDIPWNYPRFLDFATERHLLWKIGGGYLFPHRLLLDYFLPKEIAPADPLGEDSTPAP